MAEHGSIHWQELMTRDTARAKAFYGATLGWTFEEMDMAAGSEPYIVAKRGDWMVAGFFPMGDEMEGVPEHWMPYMAVDDADACAETVAEKGGEIVRPAFEMPGIGRIVIAKDAGGAVLGFITPAEAG